MFNPFPRYFFSLSLRLIIFLFCSMITANIIFRSHNDKKRRIIVKEVSFEYYLSLSCHHFIQNQPQDKIGIQTVITLIKIRTCQQYSKSFPFLNLYPLNPPFSNRYQQKSEKITVFWHVTYSQSRLCGGKNSQPVIYTSNWMTGNFPNW